jgi:hypothetical protein
LRKGNLKKKLADPEEKIAYLELRITNLYRLKAGYSRG